MLKVKKLLQRVLSAIYNLGVRAHRAERRDAMMRMGLLAIDEHTYGQPEVVHYDGPNGKATIGKYCSIARGLKILAGGMHHPDWVSTFPIRARMDLPGKFADGQPFTKGDVEIGADVWIGVDCTILSGVRIGHGAIIAAGSVCTKDVGPYEIVGGCPARLIRRRFTDEQIAALLRIAWWEWDDEQVKANVELLSSQRVDEFIRRFDPGELATAA